MRIHDYLLDFFNVAFCIVVPGAMGNHPGRRLVEYYGVFERHHNGRYKQYAEYRLENGRICMSNGCY